MIKEKVELDFENEYKDKYKLICGIDEVGRGPLCGPVVCASVIMPLENKIEGINDSKKLTAKKREFLCEEIKKQAISYSIASLDEKVIDEINILNATKKCMINALNGLDVKPDLVLIDAVKLDIKEESLSIIKGDAKSYNIACASILAKVYRDKIMDKYHEKYPVYDFINNKGYGTKKHRDALKEFGYTDIHRKSFIKGILKDTKWEIKN